MSVASTGNTPDGAAEDLRVCVVGGGNAAHALAALFPSRGYETRILASYSNEAERIREGIEAQGCMRATFASHNHPAGLVEGTPVQVSKFAKDVVPMSDVLILPLPSFAYRAVLTEIKPYVRKGMMIGVTPGQGGFDWIARDVLGDDLFGDLIFFAIMPMPFNCRITEFGKHVAVQTFKESYRVAYTPETEHVKTRVLAVTEALFGHAEPIGHFLTATMYPINAIIHPQRLYQVIGADYSLGDVLPNNPLFYEEMDAETTALMDAVNKELIAVSRSASRQLGVDCEVPHIRSFLEFVYGPHNSLTDLFSKNDAYKGFRCPFKPVSGGWVPDFANRYFTEDIPLGLCVYKGIADLAGVDTPIMDKVLLWAQTHMGKEYIVDGRLAGKDVGETSAPQAFGITTLLSLL